MRPRSPGLRAFAAGLTQPSLASVVGAFAFAAIELAAACALVTPANLARVSPLYVMRDRTDEYARTTLAGFRLSHEAPAALGVVYLGSSTARRALYDSEAPGPIEEQLRAAVGAPVRFHALQSPGQTLDESRALADRIPRSFRGVVTLVVHEDHDDDRNAALAGAHPGDALTRLAVDRDDKPKRTGVHFLDHVGWYAARRGALARIAPQRDWPRGGPPTRGGQHLSQRQWRELANRADQNPSPLLHKHARALEDLVTNIRRPGLSVVLLESPRNPLYAALKAAHPTDYRAAIRVLADRLEVRYWDLSDEAELRAEDFDDHVHLGVAAARLRFQEAYCRRLAALLTSLLSQPVSHGGATSGEGG